MLPGYTGGQGNREISVNFFRFKLLIFVAWLQKLDGATKTACDRIGKFVREFKSEQMSNVHFATNWLEVLGESNTPSVKNQNIPGKQESAVLFLN